MSSSAITVKASPSVIPPAPLNAAPAPGAFRDVLAAALNERVVAPPAHSGSGSGPPAVTLARMLSVLGSAPGTTATSFPAGDVRTSVSAPTDSIATKSAAGSTRIVDAASRYLGVPYRWGGADPATGLDCSGLVQQVFDDLGVSVPRTSVEQSRAGSTVGSLADARPGDLLFWASSRPGQANHIGIYVGEGKMLHAPYTGEVVKVAPVRTAPPTTIRRIHGV